jgi:hypothetical protein
MATTVPLQSTGAGPLVALALVAVGVAVVATFARASVRRLLAMARTDQRPVADVEPGRVEVQGEVLSAGESVEARTRGTGDGDSVVTQYRQRQGDSGDPNQTDFTLPVPQQFAPDVLNEEAVVPFYVADDTGRVLVDPAYADISLDADHSRHDAISDYAEVEAVLAPGDTVSVIGDAVQGASYDDAVAARGGLVHTVSRLLDSVGRTTADEVLDDDELVITRTDGASTFLISDTGERRGQLRQGLMAAFWTLSGGIAIVGGSYVLVTSVLG